MANADGESSCRTPAGAAALTLTEIMDAQFAFPDHFNQPIQPHTL